VEADGARAVVVEWFLPDEPQPVASIASSANAIVGESVIRPSIAFISFSSTRG
jgi:hypothetical protein